MNNAEKNSLVRRVLELKNQLREFKTAAGHLHADLEFHVVETRPEETLLDVVDQVSILTRALTRVQHQVDWEDC